VSGAVLQNYFRRRTTNKPIPPRPKGKSLSEIVNESLTEAKDGVGFWLIPTGRDEFAKAKILPSYKVGASRLSIRKKEVSTVSGRQTGTSKSDRHRRSGPSDGTFLPVWAILAQQKVLRKYFPWIGDLVNSNKSTLFDPSHPESVDSALYVQSAIMSKGWSYFVVDGDTGYFGTYFNNLPKYWDAFVSELVGEHVFAPESITAPHVSTLAFVDPRGGVIGKIDLSRVRSYDLGDARTISDAISAAKQKGASEFDKDGSSSSSRSGADSSSGYGAPMAAGSQGVNSPYDSLDFARPDFADLRFDNFVSYPIIGTYISKNGYKESDVTNVLTFLRQYKNWLASDSSNHAKVGKVTEVIEKLPELLELHAADAGYPFDASDYEERNDPDEGSEPDDVKHDTDDTWGVAAQSSGGVTQQSSTTSKQNNTDGEWGSSIPNRNPTSKQNNTDGEWGSSIPNRNPPKPPQRLELPDHSKSGGMIPHRDAARMRRNANVVDIDYTDVTDEDERKKISESLPLSESIQTLLLEVTFRRLMALTAQNGGYKYGGMVKVNGVWVYDPDVPGRIQNSAFVISKPPRPKTDEDGFVRIDYNFKSRPERSTTGMRQHGYVKFIPPGFIRKVLRKIGIGRPKSQWDMDVHVFCTCPDFKYRWHVALADKKAAARPDPSAGQAMDKDPTITNPGKKLSLCKHLVAMGSFLQKTKKEYEKDLEQWKKDQDATQRDDEDAITKNTRPTGPEESPEILDGADVTDSEEGAK
jgi:hypothetical protein